MPNIAYSKRRWPNTCLEPLSSQTGQDMPQHRTQSKTTCLLKKKVAEGHLLKYKTCTQRLNFQRIQDLPQLINKKPTQNTKQNHMLITKKVAEGHLPKYKTCPQLLSWQGRQDMSQLLNKKPTQNTQQNHMLTKREGVPKATLQSRRHASNY